MHTRLFAGAADSDLGLAGLSHLLVLRCSLLKSSRGAGPVSASLSLSSFPCNRWPLSLPGSPGCESDSSLPHQDLAEGTGNTPLTGVGAWVHRAESQQSERALSSEINWNQKFGTC